MDNDSERNPTKYGDRTDTMYFFTNFILERIYSDYMESNHCIQYKFACTTVLLV